MRFNFSPPRTRVDRRVARFSRNTIHLTPRRRHAFSAYGS